MITHITSNIMFHAPVVEEDDTCQVCGINYHDENVKSQRDWIGCDGKCGHWFHYKCVGYKRKPSKNAPLLCVSCK